VQFATDCIALRGWRRRRRKRRRRRRKKKKV